MKFSILAINSNLINITTQNSIINYLSKKLYEIGEKFSLISYFDNLEKIRENINSDNDFIFILGTNSSIFNHNIKNNLAKVFGDKFVTSESSYSSLSKYCKNNNIPFSMEEEMEVLLPENSIPLCNSDYYNNGFMYKFNNKYIVFLPSDLNFTIDNYCSYILPLIKDLTNFKSEYQVIKCFGILEKDIRSLLNDILVKKTIDIHIICDNLDSSIYFRYDNSIDNNVLQDIISDACNKLNKFIYSTNDSNIYETASELLKLHHKKVVIGETLTGGNIFKELSLINDDNIDSTYLFHKFESIIKTIKIDNNIISEYGKYSVNTIYELSNELLTYSNAGLVLFTLGDKNLDTCYMCVGDIDGIHVYKNKINIKDDKMIENLTKTAIFYLIRKLKQNNLQFI